MTYGTSANTYLVGRRPSRSSPYRRSRTVPRQRTGDPATYGAYGAFRTFKLANHPLNTSSKTSRVETSFASAAWKPATHRSKMLKLMNEHLEHLHESKDLFDHLARLVRFLRTFLQASSFVT